jgi:hypothetical protein
MYPGTICLYVDLLHIDCFHQDEIRARIVHDDESNLQVPGLHIVQYIHLACVLTSSIPATDPG